MTESNIVRVRDIVAYVEQAQNDGVLPQDVILGYESAAYLHNLGMELTAPITPHEGGSYLDEDLELVEGTSIRVTSLLRTFCDLLNRDEFVTGEVYEICSNIFERYNYPPNNLGGGEELYRLASQFVSKEILESNWEEIQKFYDFD